MSFWANAHKLGWASDQQLKKARELGKPIIVNDADSNYYKTLVHDEKWTTQKYQEILGIEF